MTVVISKRLTSGVIYLQRWDFDAQVDYWTPNPIRAHQFDGASTAGAIALQLGIDGFEVVQAGPPWAHRL